MSDHLNAKKNQEEYDFQLSLRQLWGIVLRRRYIALAAFTVVLVAGTISTLRAPNIYKSTTTLKIERKAPSILGHNVQTFDAGSMYGGYASQLDFYDTQYKIIASRPVAVKAVAKLGLSPDVLSAEIEAANIADSPETNANYIDLLPEHLREKLALVGMRLIPSKADLLDSLENLDAPAIIQSQIMVEPIDNTRLVNISVENTSPESATTLVNVLGSSFIEVNLNQKRDTAHEAVKWLSDQVADLKDRLAQSEMDLNNFKAENNIVSVSLADRRSILSQRLLYLNQTLSERKAQNIITESQLEVIRQSSNDKGGYTKLKGSTQNNHIQELKKSLSVLNQQVTDLSTRYTKNHPKLIAAIQKASLVQQQLDKELSQEFHALAQQSKIERTSIRQLNQAIQEVKDATLAANEKSADYSRLERDAANNLNLYNLLLKRQKEAQLSQMLKSNNAQILEAAKVPTAPIRPRRRLALLATLALALILSIALAMAVDLIDNTVKSQHHIEQDIGATFLGILPAIGKSDEKGAKQEQSSGNGKESQSRDQFIIANPRSSVAECSRSIRTNLFFMSPDQSTQTILVTSSSPQEGKSTVTINLGIAIAQSGRKTLIIDADMRRPRLHRSFGVSNDLGLSNVILGEATLEQAIQDLDVENLSILPCGPIPPNPAELLHTESFHKILAQLTEHYDQVVFDSPPINPVADAMVLGSMLDGVVFVTDAGKTRIPAARDARRRLEDVGARILGAILNNVDLERPSGSGYYGYQYYYYRGGYYYGESTDGAAQG